MYNLAIRKCTSPPLLAPRLILLPHRGLNPGPAESEADMLPSEPAWRAAMHSLKRLENFLPPNLSLKGCP